MTEQPTQRLFVGIELPERVRTAIDQAAVPLREIDGFRWVPVENLHVTVAFLGWVGVDAIAGIEERLAEAAARAEPFRARVVDIGRFPDRGKARVLWVGLEDPQVSLAQLAEAVRASLGGEAAHDDRPFRPHITIARARRPVAVPAMGSPLDETLDVTAVTLFRSHLGGEHARYEALRRWPLGAEPVAIP